MRVAVVGHVEWIEFARVDRMPAAGEIVHAAEWWEEPAGGGAAAAEQLRRLAGAATFYTAVGDDELGRRAVAELRAKGLAVEAAIRDAPTRRGVTHIDGDGERTITVVGERLAPRATDPLPWSELAHADAVYFTAGDPGALREARRAKILVATSRVFTLLADAGVRLDALVGSAADPTEAGDPEALDPPPSLVVWTEGSRGGEYCVAGEEPRRYEAHAPSRPVSDRYGAGDAFAAALAYGLAASGDVNDALSLAARCGAEVITGRGPYERQPTIAEAGRSGSATSAGRR